MIFKEMVRIAYAHDGSSIYGPNIYDLLFLRHLAKSNSVYFLTFNRNKVFVPERVDVFRLNEPLAMFAPNIEWIEGLRMYIFCLLRSILLRIGLRQIKPHIVLGCMATKYGFYAAVSGFKPFILIVWGSDVLISPTRSFFFRFMAKYSLKKADSVFVDSEVQKRAAIRLGCDPDKILKFPWFDLENVRLIALKCARAQIRQKLGWLDNPIIISTRSHESIYGVEYIIEAIPQILKEVPECRFLIVGVGQLTESFQSRIKELKVENCVKFVGRVSREDLISYLNASDVYISVSISDGTSASLLEAMALEVPSVVTGIPGNREWIRNSWNGCLVPVKAPVKLAKTVVSLLRDENYRQRLGSRALETVKARVDWSRTSNAITDLISKLVKEQTARGR